MKVPPNRFYSVSIIVTAAVIAMQTASMASAQYNSPSSNPAAVCEQFPLLISRQICQNCISQGHPAEQCVAEGSGVFGSELCEQLSPLERLDCQICISQGQRAVRCESEALMHQGPLWTMMKAEGTPTVIHQYPVTSAPGVANGSQPMIAPAIVPFNPQVWGLLPQAQNPSLAEPQQLAPGSVTKNDVSAWCKAFNTASGVAASISKVKDITDMLGLNSGEAEAIVNDARAAASNKTLFFLIVVGGVVVYVATEQCQPDAE
jgi:hypothetical protein